MMMNKIKILFLFAVFIQTTIGRLELLNKDDENGESKIVICIDICFQCFSDVEANELNEVNNDKIYYFIDYIQNIIVFLFDNKG